MAPSAGERHGYFSAMPESGDFLSGLYVPQSGGLIPGAAGEGGAIGGEGQGSDYARVPGRVAIPWRLSTSHSCTVPSICPLARVAPSGENAKDQIEIGPFGVAISWRLSTSHSLSLSCPMARMEPSGEKVTN